jgi:hypothetical protein
MLDTGGGCAEQDATGFKETRIGRVFGARESAFASAKRLPDESAEPSDLPGR